MTRHNYKRTYYSNEELYLKLLEIQLKLEELEKRFSQKTVYTFDVSADNDHTITQIVSDDIYENFDS